MSSIPPEALEALAADIGEAVYIDVAKWHLYLNDAKLHTQLAAQLYPLVEGDRLSEAEITAVLRGMAVPLGGGRNTVPLRDLIPITCERALMQVLADFKDRL
ncbi:MAG: DUF3181 family protein [Leptolyngbya sp. RL_3_1]|nr:DUF3181 family protein [Leptolyngbya sp. RL_3_1]